MKVVSINIGEKQVITWKGKKLETGIYKKPVNGTIYLDKEDVRNDYVIERKFHGGIFKACYMYSSNHYEYWQDLYPNLKFSFGMFGENLTVQGLDEKNIRIGDVYQIGKAKVEVTQPRQPCYKLGIKFKTQKILKQFINVPYPGVYLKVLVPGEVAAGNEMILIEKGDPVGNIKDVFHLLYHSSEKDALRIHKILHNQDLPADLRKNLNKRLRSIAD